MDFARFNLFVGERQYFQQGERLLSFLILCNVLEHCFGFAMHCQHDRLAIFGERANYLRRMRLKITDGFHLLRELHKPDSGLTRR
ncbi:hypothetical protein LCM4579_06425 [Ensifer sp. LCM 4579]|nr:hypothetical protein LCM4579_06425 [Ensifer sp. LCM 4579]